MCTTTLTRIYAKTKGCFKRDVVVVCNIICSNNKYNVV